MCSNSIVFLIVVFLLFLHDNTFCISNFYSICKLFDNFNCNTCGFAFNHSVYVLFIFFLSYIIIPMKVAIVPFDVRRRVAERTIMG